jgi:TPP-dependent pyruvate/acetoin dehydrogenase alpha subunit
MTYRARNHLERDVLEAFDDKLEEDDEVDSEVAEIISETLESTTLSQHAEAEEIVDRLIEEVEDVS